MLNQLSYLGTPKNIQKHTARMPSTWDVPLKAGVLTITIIIMVSLAGRHLCLPLENCCFPLSPTPEFKEGVPNGYCYVTLHPNMNLRGSTWQNHLLTSCSSGLTRFSWAAHLPVSLAVSQTIATSGIWGWSLSADSPGLGGWLGPSPPVPKTSMGTWGARDPAAGRGMIAAAHGSLLR